MFSVTDHSKENLAALLYQLLRKHSSNYTDEQVDRNKRLREEITRKAMVEAKELIPGASSQDWQNASIYLASR